MSVYQSAFRYSHDFLATSGRHDSEMITNAENSRPNGPPTGCIVSIFTVRTNSKSFSWAVRRVQGRCIPHFLAIVESWRKRKQTDVGVAAVRCCVSKYVNSCVTCRVRRALFEPVLQCVSRYTATGLVSYFNIIAFMCLNVFSVYMSLSAYVMHATDIHFNKRQFTYLLT